MFAVSLPNVWGMIVKLVSEDCSQKLLQPFVTRQEKLIDVSFISILPSYESFNKFQVNTHVHVHVIYDVLRNLSTCVAEERLRVYI